MHFFYPVDRMELVEVIRGEKTSDQTVVTIVALAKRIRKTPIVVKDCAGFLVNRVLFPYMNEALLLLQEGVPMDTIDAVATQFGMPMGPIALHDLVGLDTALYAGHVLAKAYPDRAVPVPILQELVQSGQLGQKSGAGFRKHGGKKPVPNAGFTPIWEKHRIGNQVPNADEKTLTDSPAVPADAARSDPRAGGRDRPRAGRRRHGPDPRHRLPPLPRRYPPLVRHRKATARFSRTSCSRSNPSASGSSRPKHSSARRGPARSSTRCPSWFRRLAPRA